MALILLKKLRVCKQMLTMAASAPCAHHGCTLNWRVATAVEGPCRRVFRWTGGCRGVWCAVALVEQKQCGGLQTPMGSSRETFHVFKILTWFSTTSVAVAQPTRPSTLRALLHSLLDDGRYLMSLWVCLCHWTPQDLDSVFPAARKDALSFTPNY